MADCPTCEYHKQRAQNWREEAYRLAGHPLPRKETMTEDDDDIQAYVKPWVGLTDEERLFVLVTAPPTFINHKGDVRETAYTFAEVVQKLTEKKLKEKNT